MWRRPDTPRHPSLPDPCLTVPDRTLVLSGRTDLVQHYDVASDPWQMVNDMAGLSAPATAALRGQLARLQSCVGSTECSEA